MPRIQANRDAIDDRFSVLGFTVKSESPLFEVGVATDPALFRADQQAARTRRNFFSSRAAGVLRARRGEAVYLVPPDVLANFVGQPKLYFGLATYRENSKGAPDYLQVPGPGNMYVNLNGLTERGLRRLVSGARASSYGHTNGRDPSLEWGGDAWPQTATPSAGNGKTTAAVPAAPAAPAAPVPYDDGFGKFPDSAARDSKSASTTNGAPAPSNGASAAGDASATTSTWTATASVPPATAQSLAWRRPLAEAKEIIQPFYDPKNPASALTCQNDAFSLALEEWFVGVGNTHMFPHSAICKLTMTGPDGSMYGGTGFYIGKNRILTCAHNLYGMSKVVVMPGSNAAGDKPYGSCTIQSSGWRVAPGYTGSGNWDNDLAVIDNVPIAAPNSQWFGFLNATPSTRMPIVICGYSAQSDAVPDLTAAIDGERQHLHGGYAAEQSGPEVIEYNILTLHGASGSPVYHLSDRSGKLEALVCAVHVTGQPAARGLNRGCFITPTKIDWIEGRARSFSLGVSARSMGAVSVHWDDVPYYPQSSPMSCWAASAAMVVGWRDRVSIADETIARMVPVIDGYRTGLWPKDRQKLADAWNLVAEPPASYTIEAWAQMLESYGPLYIDMTWAGDKGGHVRVLVGMDSDGVADGSGTTMYMYDPWPDTPGKIKLKFADFLELYENRTGNSGGDLLYQILHADFIPQGVQPVTAAPFALTLASEAEPAGPAQEPSANSSHASSDLAGSDVSSTIGNGADGTPRLRLSDGSVPALPQPPAPLVQQQGMSARREEIVESPIPGTTLRRQYGEEECTKWELDQLDGVKTPTNGAPAVSTTLRDAETVLLADWPYLETEEGLRLGIDLEVKWQCDGTALGNVRIAPVRGGCGAKDERVEVHARIADVTAMFPSDNPSCAALDVNVEYHFTRADGSAVNAVYALRLFGNDRHNLAGHWLES